MLIPISHCCRIKGIHRRPVDTSWAASILLRSDWNIDVCSFVAPSFEEENKLIYYDGIECVHTCYFNSALVLQIY
jgi:hypothetical protein